MLKGRICVVLAAISLFFVLLGQPPALSIGYTAKFWRDIQEGDNGYDVFAMRARLQEMGYNAGTTLTDEFTPRAASAVKRFQACNRMMQTGAMTMAQLEYLHSDQAKPFFHMDDAEKEGTATLEPEPTPKGQKPTASPETTATPLPPEPPRDAEGYIQGEYYREDDDRGEWVYLSEDLQVTIQRYNEPSIPLIWYETEIICRGKEQLNPYENNVERPGAVFKLPEVIAKNYNLVLGFTDDFYGYRVYNKKTVGMVIRDGAILGKKTMKDDTNYLPNLDVLAQFPDGSMKAYRCKQYTSEELLAMGAIHTYCFGPVLLQEGMVDSRVEGKYYEQPAPRQALGMLGPNHYVVLTVQGRIKESRGAGLIWVANRMKEMGVTEALNLDGGNTVALVFRGRMLNALGAWKGKSFVRSVSSLIGIGEPAK